MKLTCRCGASIEIDGERCSMAEIEQWNKFWVKHEESCGPLKRGPIMTIQTAGGPITVTRIVPQTFEFNLCPKCGGVGCICKVPDPYQRFRDAIKEGKRVFHWACEKMTGPIFIQPVTARELIEDGIYAENLFVESVDIPTQPTQETLDKYELELTGECRIPTDKDRWISFTGKSVHVGVKKSCQFDVLVLDKRTYSGRRWIVRKKKDDGFEKWISEHAAEFGKGTADAARKIWTAAQEAAKK